MKLVLSVREQRAAVFTDKFVKGLTITGSMSRYQFSIIYIDRHDCLDILPINEVVAELKRTSPLSREQPNLADHRASNVRI